mgnify:CR=1 FL=1
MEAPPKAVEAWLFGYFAADHDYIIDPKADETMRAKTQGGAKPEAGQGAGLIEFCRITRIDR